MSYIKKSKEYYKNEVQKLSQELEMGLEQVFHTDEYVNFLNIMAKRPNYSVRNNILIYMQKPDATFLAGYQTLLNSFGHQVQKGEKGIRIFAPVIYKTQRNDSSSILGEPEEDKKIRFRVIKIFDISQTKPVMIQNEDGSETISPKAKKLIQSLNYMSLTGTSTNKEDSAKILFDTIQEAIPIPIKYQQLPKTLAGYFSFKNRDNLHIVLNSSFDITSKLVTLVHEWTHYELHNPYDKKNNRIPKMSNKDQEIQAESVAYIVLKHFGFDSSNESLKYIAIWSKHKKTEDLRNSLEIIQKTSVNMIAAIKGIRPIFLEEDII